MPDTLSDEQKEALTALAMRTVDDVAMLPVESELQRHAALQFLISKLVATAMTWERQGS